jgi:8-oxo-dGTP pyrophosphatase MutT (NUDIX family)
MMTTNATLCEIIKDSKILLQRKAAGKFGEKKWNGPGGKMINDETPEECVIREVLEETGLLVNSLSYHGEVEFYFGVKNEADWNVYIYSTGCFSGVLKESEEGELRWFRLEDIPYDKMWEDDLHWLPLLLANKRFKGSFTYDEEGDNLLNYDLKLV